MNSQFEVAFAHLLGFEGGYVNDPRDPGGETKYGISKRYYPDLDIKNLTLDAAKAIYKRDYWGRARCDELPPRVALLVFDCAVNSGIAQAVQLLQRAVGVTDDGAMGPKTLSAVSYTEPGRLAARFLGQRLALLVGLDAWSVFGKGWSNRVASQLQDLTENPEAQEWGRRLEMLTRSATWEKSSIELARGIAEQLKGSK